MGPTVTISVSVTLLALAAGTYLLARSNRENFGLLYKIIAWFIIVGCFLNLACCAMHCMMRFYGKQYMHKEEKMHRKFNHEGMWESMGPGNFHHAEHWEDRAKCYPDGKCEEETDWKKCYMHLKDSCAAVKK